MKILAVDSSARTASAAVCEDGVPIVQYSMYNRLTHSRTLLPMIESMLSHAGMTMSEIDLLAVSAGPGSFTGVRIGVSMIKGMSLALDIPCVGVSSLRALAYNMRGIDSTVCTVMDARAGQVYGAMFEWRGECIRRIEQDSAVAVAELDNWLREVRGDIFLVGDGAQMCYNEYKERASVRLADESRRWHSALSTARAALEDYEAGLAVSGDALDVSYLRPSQAERERMARTGG